MSYQHDTIVPFGDSNKNKTDQVAEMFDNIAGRYDFLNHFLSAGIDIGWRKTAIKQLIPLHPQRILDVATGTGDVAIMAYKLLKPQQIIGIDISRGMLQIGNEKIQKLGLQNVIQLVSGDSETIMFDNDSFDGATVAFGVRNFEHLEEGLKEIKRVLKPGGKLVILEFSQPKLPFIKQVYKFYLNKVAPGIGGLISRNKSAYRYLNESVQKFPEGKTFVDILSRLGYKNASCKKLSLGIASIYCGEK